MNRISFNISSILALLFIGLMSFSLLALAVKASAEQNQMGPMAVPHDQVKKDNFEKDRHIHQEDAVYIGQDRIIGQDEVMAKGIVVVGADLTVYGRVNGDVVCIGGNLNVGPQAIIKGDLVNIGGHLSVDPSAKTYKDRVNIGGFSLGFLKYLKGVRNGQQKGAVYNYSDQKHPVLKLLRLALDCIYLLFLLFFALLLTIFMPRQFNKIEEYLSNEFPRCTLLGIASMIGFPLILLAFVITLVGILAVPFLLLAWGVSYLVGYIVFSRILGQRLLSGKTIMLQILAGLLLLHCPLLVGDLLLLTSGDILSVIGHVFRTIGIILFISVNFIGFGAVVYSILGKRGLIRAQADKPNGFSGSSENGDTITI